MKTSRKPMAVLVSVIILDTIIIFFLLFSSDLITQTILYISIFAISVLVLNPLLTFHMMRKSVKDFDRFNKIMIDRELKMIELKKDIKKLMQNLDINSKSQYEDRVRNREMRLLQTTRTPDDVKKALSNILEDLKTNTAKIGREKVKDEAILESIGDGMVATDENGRVTMMNSAA